MKTLREFIDEQPKARPINFKQATAGENECGCLLVHWGREEGLKGTICAGFDMVYPESNCSNFLSPPDSEFCDKAVSIGCARKPKTYGQLRTLLKEAGL